MYNNNKENIVRIFLILSFLFPESVQLQSSPEVVLTDKQIEIKKYVTENSTPRVIITRSKLFCAILTVTVHDYNHQHFMMFYVKTSNIDQITGRVWEIYWLLESTIIWSFLLDSTNAFEEDRTWLYSQMVMIRTSMATNNSLVRL